MVSAGYIHKCNSLPIPFHEHLPPPGAADAMMEQHMLSFFFLNVTYTTQSLHSSFYSPRVVCWLSLMAINLSAFLNVLIEQIH